MKCPIDVAVVIEGNKLFIDQETSESKVKAYIPMY
jgi:hypothetical protein